MQVLCVGLRRETRAEDPSPFSCLPWNRPDPVRASVCGQRLPPVARRVIFSRDGQDPYSYGTSPLTRPSLPLAISQYVLFCAPTRSCCLLQPGSRRSTAAHVTGSVTSHALVVALGDAGFASHL